MDASVLLIKARGGGWTVSELPENRGTALIVTVICWRDTKEQDVDLKLTGKICAGDGIDGGRSARKVEGRDREGILRARAAIISAEAFCRRG
jgi:hypothetical protein